MHAILQCPIDVITGANEREMREGLGEISQCLSTWADFLSVEIDMIGVGKQLFQTETGLFNIASTRQRINEPEATDIKRAFCSREPIIRRFFHTIAIDM